MKKSILHVIATLDRGGTEVTALDLAREFARRGFDNRVVALALGLGQMTADFRESGIQAEVLPAGRLARARAMHTLVRQVRPDAVFFHIFNIEHVIMGAAARFAGVRDIATKLGNPVGAEANMVRKTRIIVHLTNLLGIGVISASKWIARSLAEAGCTLRYAAIIRNGCDVEAVAARVDAARIGRDPGAVVGMVSRLDPIKDHATLLDAFARLPKTIEGRVTRLVLVGDGPLREPLEQQAVRLGITDRLTFAGARADVPEMLANVDVFSFSTTRDEGFGVVLIEALAAGTPIIASDVPACREVLQDGRLGCLVPAADADALAEALHKALDRAPAVPPRSEVMSQYGLEAVADEHLTFLLRCRRDYRGSLGLTRPSANLL